MGITVPITLLGRADEIIEQRFFAVREAGCGPTRKEPGPPTESAHRGEPENLCSF
jgi:hypothetical protein